MRITPGWPVVGALVLTLLAGGATAQDANYWALQYGPVAQLLGGQVIGSDHDLSSTYYNPGGLALGEGANFLLSTEAVELESFSTEGSQFELFDTSSTRFGAAPTQVAGSLPRSWLGEETRLAWSFLTRQELKVRLGQRLVDPFRLEPEGTSATEFYLDNWVNESWVGLTVSRKLSETMGIGVTAYGIYRGQRSRSELSILATSPEEGALSAFGITEFKYYHLRMLAKVGVAWEPGPMRFGLNVTTPSAGLFGSGDAGYTLSLIGVDSDNNGLPDPPVLASRTREDLDVTYRSSWAIGGGFAWYRGTTRWHTSAEWFAPVDRFTVLDLPLEDGDPQALLTQQLKSVFNIGLGVEHDFGSQTQVYGAARTDFSASVGDPEVNVAVSNWDLYHLNAGVKFAVAGNRFTLGATYSFGSQERPLGIAIPPEDLPESALDETLSIRYRRVVLLLGFLFGSNR